MGKLAAMGVKEVQLHEPAVVMWDSSTTLAAMFKKAYFAVRDRQSVLEFRGSTFQGGTTLPASAYNLIAGGQIRVLSSCLFWS